MWNHLTEEWRAAYRRDAERALAAALATLTGDNK